MNPPAFRFPCSVLLEQYLQTQVQPIANCLKMSKGTVTINSKAEFDKLLKSSRIVVADCKNPPSRHDTPPPCFKPNLDDGQYERAFKLTYQFHSLGRMVRSLQTDCSHLRNPSHLVVAS